MRAFRSLLLALAVMLLGGSLFVAQTRASEGEKPVARDYARVTAPPSPRDQSVEAMAGKSDGCFSCHVQTDAPTMHVSSAVRLGCTDCHGGDASIQGNSKLGHDDPLYVAARDRAHVLPKYPDGWHWPSSANPKGILHAPQPRGSGLRPLRQPLRLPSSARELWGLPHGDDRGG